MQPTTIGRYQILRELGRGGMATVYEGFDATLNRYAAVKVMDVASSPGQEAVLRLLQEATKIARLEAHRAILTIYEADVDGERPFIAMRKVDGGSLEQRIRAGSPPLEFVRRVMAAVGGALDYAHRHGIVHCDVKPSNILLDALGQPYLTDFGVSRARPDVLGVSSDDGYGYTMRYASPEQMAGAEPTASSDIYALGLVVYEMLTGRLPFGHVVNPQALFAAKANQQAPRADVVNRRVPPAIADVVARAIAAAPGERFAGAAEFVAAFLAASDDEALGEGLTRVAAPVLGRTASGRGWRAAVGIVVGIALVVGAGAWWMSTRKVPAPVEGVPEIRRAKEEQPSAPTPDRSDGRAAPGSNVGATASPAVATPPVGDVPAEPKAAATVPPSTAVAVEPPPEPSSPAVDGQAHVAAATSGPPEDAAASGPRSASVPTVHYRLPPEWKVTPGEAVGVATGLPARVVDDASGIDFVLIEPGTFVMGDDRGSAAEQPAHEVAITRPFYLSRTEVSVEQLRRHPAPGGAPPRCLARPFLSYWPGEPWDERHPAVKITRAEAAAFAKANGYRLPTEAQWEFAARAGTTTRRWFGDDLALGEGGENGFGPNSLRLTTGALYPDGYYHVRAWPFDDGFLQTAPVGSLRPNPWGLCDMLGNVQEWVRDAWDAEAYRKRAGGGPVRDPVVEDADSDRGVVRGGGWNTDPKAATASARQEMKVDAQREGIGFRVVRELE